ncbi:MAG: radical SAM protein [Candidatus Kaelpia aquatica]|nr:radical SAM protein [Candidatus Kaelpia aquatica]
MKMFQPLIDGTKSDLLLLMVHTWHPWMPPLGISYISSYMESKGYKTLLFDFNAKLYNNVSDEKKKFWDISITSSLPQLDIVGLLISSFSKEIDELIDIILKRPEPIIGFSANYLSIYVVNHIAKIIKSKNSDKLLVAGGPGCFWDFDRSVIDPGVIDIFVLGEGEGPFYKIVESFYKKSSLENIPGTIFVKDKKEIDNSPADPISDLNTIPYPDFKNLDLNDYGFGEKQTRTLPLLTSRGCISKCTFCVDHFMCAPFRMRDPKNIVDEIKFHIKENGVRNFSFNDLLCNGNLKKLRELAELIKKESLSIQWGSYAVARGDMDLELLKSLKDAGCVSLCYGIESGSDKVLKVMRKIYNTSDAERVLRLTKEAGMKATFNIIIGYPGEGRREFQQTLRFVKRNRAYIENIINVSTLFINPTAALGMEPEKFNIYFPKFPQSFKFISLKKAFIPRYYNIFGISSAVKDMKGVDISEFVDKSGNTKPVRLKRLVKTLYFLQRLGLFRSEPIINVYATKDKKVKKAIEYIRSRQILTFGDLSVKCSREGFVKIFLKHKCITAGPGLNVAFLIKDHWYDTSRYVWDIKKIGLNRIEIMINMGDVAIEHKWILELKPEGLHWHIKVCFKAKNYTINDAKMGLMLSEFYKYWYSKSYQGEFPILDDNWKSLDLGDVQSVWAMTEGESPFGVEMSKIESSIPLSLRMESSLTKYSFRFLAFRNKIIRTCSNNKLDVKLFLGFREMSKSYLKIKEDKEILEKKEFQIVGAGDELNEEKEPLSLKRSSFLDLIIDKGVKLYYKQSEITSECGVVVTCHHNDRILDSRDAIWSSVGDKNCDIFDLYWENICFQIELKIRVKRNNILWSFRVYSLENTELKELKIGIFLNKKYDSWSLGPFKGGLPDNVKDRWGYLPLTKSNDNKILLNSSQNSLPALAFSKSKQGFFQIEVPDLNIAEGKIVCVVFNNLFLKSGKPLDFNYKIGLEE